MLPFRPTALSIMAATVVCGCSSQATPRPTGTDIASPTDRASDGLLFNPVLQNVVDLQLNRDAEGLINYLSHSDPLVRARAAFAAASIQSALLTPHLTDLLTDPDPRVRADAAFALGQTGDSTVGKDLTAALWREREIVAQARIVEAIGKTAPEDILTELVTMEAHSISEPEVALAIARFGSRDIHTPQSVEWVARRLTHPSADLRMNASFYFGITSSSRPWALHAAYVRDAIEDYGIDEPAAMHVATGLGRFHGADGRLMLTRLSDAVDWRVRTNTAQALAPLSSDPRVLDGLLDALDDPSQHVITAAAGSLGWSEILEDTHLERLERWVTEHPDAYVPHAEILSILANQRRDDFVLRHVRETIKHDRPGLAGLLSAVALVQTDAAFSLLSGLTQSSEPIISESAVEALVARWTLWRGEVDGPDRFYDTFADALRHQNPRTVVAAALAMTETELKDLGSLELVAQVYERLSVDDIESTIDLMNALGGTGDTKVLAIVRRGNQHENPLVRRTAAQAVARLTGKDVAVEDWFLPTGAEIDWSLLTSLGAHPTLQLETTRGTILIELFTEQAPYGVQTVVTGVRSGIYDDTGFHRVIPNFVVQGGDVREPTGKGHAQPTGRTEYTRIRFLTGVVGLSNVGKDTEGSQFFITHSMQPQLDGTYTSFGNVIGGMDVVDSLLPGDRIVTAKIFPDAAT